MHMLSIDFQQTCQGTEWGVFSTHDALIAGQTNPKTWSLPRNYS